MRSILSQMQDDPLWLERPDCPYDAPLRESLEAMWLSVRPRKVEVAPSAVERAEGTDKWSALAEDAENLFADLMAMKGTLDGDDVKEQLAFYKTVTSVMDKLITLSERASNLKQVGDFQARVVAVFDAVLTPEQRTTAMRMMSE